MIIVPNAIALSDGLHGDAMLYGNLVKGVTRLHHIHVVGQNGRRKSQRKRQHYQNQEREKTSFHAAPLGTGDMIMSTKQLPV